MPSASHRSTPPILIRLHLHHLILNSNDGARFRMMHALRAEQWTRIHVVPASALPPLCTNNQPQFT
ncbi:hypothetical protein ACHHYP_20136 [Achlya hypogyna]|uniref:Uncharacterized protein n=1 Tax=Achlya hypogyna TaxID=1202772 RepID=A0A1V9Z3J8_ACHHY|nr:hypothetical protein ACHHYP_20136 [Achlya hypogyna]